MGIAKEIDLILTADWHLHHPRVPSAHTIQAIRDWLFPLIPKTKVLAVTGDIFNGSVSMNSDCAPQIIGLFIDILELCYENEVVFRVLQGTFTHDRNQLKLFDKLVKKFGLPIDYAWVNTIKVEHIKAIDGHILYLPDDLPYRNKSEVFDQVRDLFTANGISSVDYVMMHGEFDHTECGQFSRDAYTQKDFNKICKKLVLSGHIHTPSKRGKVVYAGSINRLAHNEEEAKGFWKVVGSDATFVTNPDAAKFVTVDYCKFNDLNELIEEHKSIIETFPNGTPSFIRVIIRDVHMKQALVSFHHKTYPDTKITFKKADSKDSSESSQYLDVKLNAKRTELMEVPSAKNIANIVCRYLHEHLGCELQLNRVDTIINGGL